MNSNNINNNNININIDDDCLDNILNDLNNLDNINGISSNAPQKMNMDLEIKPKIKSAVLTSVNEYNNNNNNNETSNKKRCCRCRSKTNNKRDE